MTPSLFLVMDMINDLTSPDGPSAGTYAPLLKERRVIERIVDATARARKAGVAIGYVRVGFSPDYRECPPSSPVFSRAREVGLFKLGTWGTEVHPALAPQPQDFDFVKHRVSPFYGTSLEPVLRARGFQRLYMCGVSTNGVVHLGAREAQDRDYECIVLADCSAGATDDEHETALKSLGRFAAIKDSNEIRFGG